MSLDHLQPFLQFLRRSVRSQLLQLRRKLPDVRRRGRADPLRDLFVEVQGGPVGSPPGLREELAHERTEPPVGHVLVQEESRQDLPQVVSRVWEEDKEAKLKK